MRKSVKCNSGRNSTERKSASHMLELSFLGYVHLNRYPLCTRYSSSLPSSVADARGGTLRQRLRLPEIVKEIARAELV